MRAIFLIDVRAGNGSILLRFCGMMFVPGLETEFVRRATIDSGAPYTVVSSTDWCSPQTDSTLQ